jgi:hypothetical protein
MLLSYLISLPILRAVITSIIFNYRVLLDKVEVTKVYSSEIGSLPSTLSSNPIQLKSSLELTEIIHQVNVLLPQLSDFISQFHQLVATNSINVITETNGNMSIDVPVSMSDMEAEKLSKRINILDRVI